jgi:hypothetical protein
MTGENGKRPVRKTKWKFLVKRGLYHRVLFGFPVPGDKWGFRRWNYLIGKYQGHLWVGFLRNLKGFCLFC